MGIVGNRNSSKDYDADMIGAKKAGIDAFALNIGEDRHTDEQLNFAYESAAKNDMKVFISFDFNSYSVDDAAGVGQQIAKYADKPAQLKVDDRVLASSFVGDGLDVTDMKKAAMKNVKNLDIFFIPNFNPEGSDSDEIDGGFNWQVSFFLWSQMTSCLLYRDGQVMVTTRPRHVAKMFPSRTVTRLTRSGSARSLTWLVSWLLRKFCS